MVIRYKSLGISTTNPVTEITAGVKAVNDKNAALLLQKKKALTAAKNTYTTWISDPNNTDRGERSVLNKAVAAAEVDLDKELDTMKAEKIPCVSNAIRKLWVAWSPTLDVYFPIAAFMNTPIPALVKTIEWVEVRFTATDCKFENVCGDTAIAMPPKPPNLKPAKKKKKYALLSTGPVLGGVKRPLGDRPPPSKHGLAMTLENEGYVNSLELEDDLVPNIDDEAEEDDGDDEAVVPDVHMPQVDSLNVQSRVTTLSSFSSIFASGVDSLSDSLILEDGTNADNFVLNLQDSCLLLAESISAVDQWHCTLSSDDTLQVWLESFFPGPIQGGVGPVEDLSVNVSGTCTTPSITDYQLTWGFKTVAGSSQLTFDTAYTLTAFNLNKTAVSGYLDDQGYLNKSTGLLLGLVPNEASTKFSITLAETFQLLDIEWSPLLVGDAQLQIFTSSDTVNGFWLYPSENNAVACRLNLSPRDGGQKNSTWLAIDFPGLTITGKSVVIRRQAYQSDMADPESGSPVAEPYTVSSNDICLNASVKMSENGTPWDAYVSIGDTSLGFIMRWNADGDPLSELWTWIADSFKLNTMQESYKSFSSIGAGTIALREVSFIADNSTGSWKFQSVSIQFQWNLPWGIVIPNALVPVSLRFTYTVGDPSPYIDFRGNLWPELTGPQLKDDLLMLMKMNSNAPLPPLLTPSNIATQPYQYYISLSGLLDKAQKDSLPSIIPTKIINLSFDISTDSISFAGNVIVDPSAQPDPDNKPWLVLNTITINAMYQWNSKALTFGFAAEMLLQPRMPPPTYVTTLDVEIDYDSTNSAWTFMGSLYQLNVGCLYSLFPIADRDQVMDLMEDIMISNFNIIYHHETNYTSFASNAVILLGDVELDLTFTYDASKSAQSSWTFDAILSDGYSPTGQKLGDFLSSISNELASILPDFVYNTDISILDGSSIELKCEKTTSGYMLFALIAKVTDFEFAFCQLSTTAPDPNDIDGVIRPKKRLFKFTMPELPAVHDVPLLASLTQPFDQMDFLWLGEDLTRAEVNLLNTEVFKVRKDRLVFKDPRLETSNKDVIDPDPTKQANDKVILAGCHFIIVVEQSNIPTAVLDHNFTGTPLPPPPSQLNDPFVVDDSSRLAALQSTVSTATPPVDSGSTSGVWTKTIGPLTISAISLKYQDGLLSITLNATVSLGAVTGILKGFGVQFPMTDLYKFDIPHITVLIEGVGLEMNRPPVVLAGMMVKSASGYAGGVTIEVEPYTFLAGGYYGTITKTNGDKVKTIFVYAELDGPIAELEFASLSGLTGGFGYNSELRMPTVDNVTTFPFLAQSTQGSDPLAVLNNLMTANPPWFSPQDGPVWVAGGITVKAFQVLDIKAVIVVDLTEDVIFAIFADCTASIPESATNSAERFALIDMGLLALLDYSKGIFHTEGQLTPKSFILDQNCHLTGGFALAYWFGGSGHEGDWVFSVGGYHAAFVRFIACGNSGFIIDIGTVTPNLVPSTKAISHFMAV